MGSRVFFYMRFCPTPLRFIRCVRFVVTGFSLSVLSGFAAEAGNDPALGFPSISVARGQAGHEIRFQGILQSAQTIPGTWTEVTGAVSPYRLEPTEVPRFYRAMESGSVFSGGSVLELALRGPFQEYFDLAFAGIPDGIFPPVRSKPYFDGILQMANLELPVQIRVRGNSSLQECSFPKLKFKVARKDREGTPFADAREVKVGTHCAEGGQGNIGRLRHETAAFREAAAYDTMTLIGFIGPRVRKARIHYQDSTGVAGSGDTGWEITRMALLLDGVEVVAERLNGRALEDEEVAALKNAGFDEQLVADLQLFNTLIGNWDYALSLDGQGLWNTEVIELSDGKLVPVAGDFDLASWVTGKVLVTGPRDYLPELDDLVRQTRFRLSEIRLAVGDSRFGLAAARFLTHREAIELLIASAEIDPEGRENAMRHVDVFFEALSEVQVHGVDGLP
mgnify:CR=1 FL=1